MANHYGCRNGISRHVLVEKFTQRQASGGRNMQMADNR